MVEKGEKDERRGVFRVVHLFDAMFLSFLFEDEFKWDCFGQVTPLTIHN